ncbi:hypothetical protein BDZ89DRAFT_1130352 [Hymenopellis radicata]|nr:hypothetical protein BDZ89DRAFT_1130352 [Hymenopellis radicata]
MGQPLYSVQLEQKYHAARTMSTPRRPRTSNSIRYYVPRVPPNSSSSVERESAPRIQFRDRPESPLQRRVRSRLPRSPAPRTLSRPNGFSPAPTILFAETPATSRGAHPDFASDAETRSPPANLPRPVEGLVRPERYSENDDPFSDDYKRETPSADSDSDDEFSAAWTLEQWDSDSDDDEVEEPRQRSRAMQADFQKVYLGANARGQEI